MLGEYLHHPHDQIVKIESVRLRQFILVKFINPCHVFLEIILGLGGEILPADQPVLGGGDAVLYRIRRDFLGGYLKLFHAFL